MAGQRPAGRLRRLRPELARQDDRDRLLGAADPDARVSAPLLWEEVPAVDPAAFTIETMPERIAQVGDPTAGMWRHKASLPSRFERLD